MQVNLNTPNYSQPIFGCLRMPTKSKMTQMFGPVSAAQVESAVPKLETMASGLEVRINAFKDPSNIFKGLFISVTPERTFWERFFGIRPKTYETNRILIGSNDFRQPANNMGTTLTQKVEKTIKRFNANA